MRNKNPISNELYGIVLQGENIILHSGGVDIRLTTEEAVRLGEALIALGKDRIDDLRRMLEE